MRGRGALALAAAAALVLTGCGGRDWLPYAREMGDMAVLRTLGVDGGAGEVELTAATGERVSGMSAQSRPALVLSARGRSLSQACLAVQGLGSEYVFFGYVDQILLGEGLAREDVMPLLNYLAGDVELGLGAQLWVIQGARAGEAIQAAGEEGVSGRLTQLQADSEMGAAEITRTAGELLTALESGTSTYLPALALTPAREGDGGEGAQDVLSCAGYGVLRKGTLVCFVQGEAARGLELLEEQAPARAAVLELEDGCAVSVRVTGARVRCVPVFQGERLTGLELSCRLQARVVEAQAPLSGAQAEELGRALERREGEGMVRALALSQYWDADFLDLLRRAGLAAPERWEQLREQWSGAFRSLEIRVEVKADVEREFGIFGGGERG